MEPLLASARRRRRVGELLALAESLEA